MSDQTRGIVFVVVVIAITFIWMHFFQPPVQPPKPAPAAAQTAPSTPGTNPKPAARKSVSAKSARPVIAKPAQAQAETNLVIDSSVYRVELSNRGGVVHSWKLKKYLNEETPPRPLDLVNPDAAKELGWPFSIVLADPQLEAEANSALYEMTPATQSATAPVEVTFHWSDGHLDVTKKLSFEQDYQLSVEVEVTLDGKPLPATIAWLGGFGDRAAFRESQFVSVFYKQNDKLNTLPFKKLGQPGNQIQPLELAGPMEYAGIQDQFFAAAFIPDGTDISLWDWGQWHHSASNGQAITEPEAQMAAGAMNPGPLKVRVYIGPKDLTLLGKVHPSLEELVSFGWFGVIAKPLLFVLEWMHKYIPNYGWTIVIFTLLLTMALLPIRIWTFHSARKMQMVAPEVKSIQDKYKKYSMSDPRKRKMNEEVMAVYQREGINPLGSCLPMLVQLPVLWAFYRVLNGAIALRHAPWFWWIHDLSAKDPYYILPVLMVITSYFMTKMTPTPTAAADPAQQKMMALMPVFMGFIFINLSSGLNLYYFSSNLIGVVQQWYLNRSQPLPSRSKFKSKKKE
ncbi:MAG TPA: membrane protein insertase YidC [Candidatus Acidoferrales bacterium]|jgi:YidC/Oxa1 family membrane protein insertase|nr:membrane protein insertase YidC [Candidatus Acidoferrales bacterium]